MPMLSVGGGQVTGAGFRPSPAGFESPRLHQEEISMSAAAVLTFPQAPKVETTHEAFVHAVRDAVVARLKDEALRARLTSAKLVYGGGPAGVRGICYYGAWSNGAE